MTPPRPFLYVCGVKILAIAAACLLLAGCSQPEAPALLERPNILLITLDTTRADRLGAYGYSKDTSPKLDALAAESVFYTRAVATSSWTLPSHASLFTGKFTRSHGARYDAEGPLRLLDAIDGQPSWEQYRARGLARDEVTLAQLLSEAGYETGAVIGGPWLKKVFGLDRGFTHYDDSQVGTVAGRQADSMTQGALGWLDTVEGKPFFLFLNYYDPHGPYAAPRDLVEKFLPPGGVMQRPPRTSQQLNALYDGEVAFMDRHIGVLLDRLKESGEYDRTWIIVTADHGELLGEHRIRGHGTTLYEEELHIPMFMKYPAGEAEPVRSDERIQLVDLFPLICERLGLVTPEGIQGTAPPGIDHPIVSEVYPVQAMSQMGDWQALYDGDFKFVWSSLGRHQLFNLAADPGETRNLVSLDPGRRDDMAARLLEYLEGLPEPGEASTGDEIDEQTKEALESLGYVN